MKFLKKFKRRSEQFFCGEANIAALVVCRVVIGLCLFFHYFSLRNEIQLIFGPDGLLGANFFENVPGAHSPSFGLAQGFSLRFITSARVVDFLFCALLLSAFSFTFGCFTRLSGIALFILHLLFHGQNEFAFWGWGDLIKPFLLYIICSDAGQYWSLDAWKKSKKLVWVHWRKMRGSFWPIRLLQVHICAIYLVVAWSRLDDPNWLDGSMLYGVLTDPRFGRIDSDWRFCMPVLRALCYGSWLVELGAPIMLWISRTRKAWALLLMLLHAGLEIFTMVGYWDFLMIAALTVFLFPEERKCPDASNV